MTPKLAKSVNTVFLLMICTPLVGAYGVQFIKGEFPCPLCLLQRLAMLGIACGVIMNLRFGIRPMHYGMYILSAVFGACVSTRQVLLHIVPGQGSTGYGDPVMGMHLYTWALLIFMATILLLGIMFLFDSEFETPPSDETQRPQKISPIAHGAFWIALGVTIANVVTTFLECGLKQCPDNPTSYLML